MATDSERDEHRLAAGQSLQPGEIAHRHYLRPKSRNSFPVAPMLLAYTFLRTTRRPYAPGPREAARRLFDTRAARYSCEVRLRRRATDGDATPAGDADLAVVLGESPAGMRAPCLACQCVGMQVRPVIDDPATVVSAVAGSIGQPLSLRGQLDVDVYRVHPCDAGPDHSDVVVRVFGPRVERATVATAAHVLQRLAGTRFPAERCWGDVPLLALGEGRHVLLTEYVEPSPAPGPGFVLAWCAGLLSRLAVRPATDLPAGGGWHRLGPTPSREIDEALALGGSVGPSVTELVDTLADADDGTGLPEALIHADLTPPNAVPRGGEPPVIIDWIGVGRGPRIWPLAFLLYAAGPAGARRALDRYAGSVALSEEERARLPAMMIARPLTLDLWAAAYGRMTARQAVVRCRTHRARVGAITAALDGPDRA